MSGLELPDNYPSFKPPATAYNPKWDAKGNSINLLVEVGDYIVNREGHISIATTGNKGPYGNGFLKQINQGSFRAKYLGCDFDYLELASQSRKATASEIKKAQKFEESLNYVLSFSGQTKLL